MKIQAKTANPTGNVLQVLVRQERVSGTAMLDWTPTITTTATWYQTTFTPTFTSDTLELYLNGLNVSGSWGGCTGFDLDEIYLYEDIAADRLIIDNHECCNGRITSLYGCECDPDRSSFSYANDASANLQNAVWIDQSDTAIKTFTSSNYPVWELILERNMDLTYEIGQMFVGPKMDVEYLQVAGFDTHGSESHGTMTETVGGKRWYSYDYERGVYSFGVKVLDEVTHDKWVEWWEEVGRSKFPFWFAWDETDEPEDIKFVRCDTAFQMPKQLYGGHYRIGQVRLREEL